MFFNPPILWPFWCHLLVLPPCQEWLTQKSDNFLFSTPELVPLKSRLGNPSCHTCDTEPALSLWPDEQVCCSIGQPVPGPHAARKCEQSSLAVLGDDWNSIEHRQYACHIHTYIDMHTSHCRGILMYSIWQYTVAHQCLLLQLLWTQTAYMPTPNKSDRSYLTIIKMTII